MPSKWIGCIHKGQADKEWGPREKTHRYDPEDKSCNTETPEYAMWLHDEFSTQPTKQDWPSFVKRVRLPLVSMGAR